VGDDGDAEGLGELHRDPVLDPVCSDGGSMLADNGFASSLRRQLVGHESYVVNDGACCRGLRARAV
jgi:hypothetical protein